MTILLRLLHPPSVAGVAASAHTRSRKAVCSALVVYLVLQGEKYKMVRSFALCIGMVLFSTAARAQLEDLGRRAGLDNAGRLSDSKMASGLKEALRVGADNAVKLTGKTDGYFGNEAIKILMPSNLRPLERGLRAIGFGPKIDEFILSMNRSAEAAAPAAKKIFGDAILAMTFDDARKILSGGDTAATEYFKGKTSAQLTAAFQPFVEKTMSQNGVTQQYKALTDQYQSIPFAKARAWTSTSTSLPRRSTDCFMN